jgi:hypothetical protein
MTSCDVLASGAIELYFYGELDGPERDAVTRHLAGCDACRHALEDLAVIRDALSALPDVSAPEGGDWGRFMARLGNAVAAEKPLRRVVTPAAFAPRSAALRPSFAGYLAMAALLALVTMTVLFVVRSREEATGPAPAMASGGGDGMAEPRRPEPDPSLATISEQHFEKSKLVLLGLATREAGEPAGWEHERDLAEGLLNDTRLYRLAAENRGMSRLAGVLRDLELVLLQASMTDERDPAALGRIQRFIEKRDVIGQMDAVSAATTGS